MVKGHHVYLGYVMLCNHEMHMPSRLQIRPLPAIDKSAVLLSASASCRETWDQYMGWHAMNRSKGGDYTVHNRSRDSYGSRKEKLASLVLVTGSWSVGAGRLPPTEQSGLCSVSFPTVRYVCLH